MSKSKRHKGSFDSLARRRQRGARNAKRQKLISVSSENYSMIEHGAYDLPDVVMIRSARGSGRHFVVPRYEDD